ncbi:unnamed protein product [Lathyrus oleraceus]
MYLRSLKAYCRCAASFCYSFKLELCFLVRCCWSYFGLEMLQDVATTKYYAEVFSPDEER